MILRLWAIGLAMLLTGVAHAADYPRTVVDLAGRGVRIAAAPQRILLQDSNDLLALALLERDDPLRRVIAWNNNLRSSDPSLWKLLVQRWPQAEQVKNLTFSNGGEVDIEGILRARPDLIVARLESRAAVDNSVLGALLERLGIPLIYVDSESDPLHHVPRSIALLGQTLGREAQADAYLQAYRGRLQGLLARTVGLPARRVFVEARAGQAGGGACCHTQADSGWGLMVQALGGINLGSRLLVSESGDVALETLVRSKPDLYLMTGTQRVRNGVATIPFGYGVSDQAIQAELARLMARPGFANVAQTPQSCVQGLYHQFYNSVFNIVGLEYLAQMLWPERFADLDPAADYRRLVADFTQLPDAPFAFQAQRCFAEDSPP